MAGMNLPYILEAALMAIVLLFSVIVHEVAHGYVALINGDPTAKMLGRITLNPVPHIDLFGTILLPLLLYFAGGPVVGWAKPVPVNPLNYRNYRWAEFAVSAAGIVSNLCLAALFSILLRLGLNNPGFNNPGLMAMAKLGFSLNIFLAVFNLIPIPPLDGSHILALLLPRELARLYAYLQPVGFIIILILAYTNILWMIMMPMYREVVRLMLG